MRMLHIVNRKTGRITEGGSSRENALAAFLASKGASAVAILDSRFQRGSAQKLIRLPRLLREIRQFRPELVALNYPSYPFFWQFRVTKYFWSSAAFALWLRSASRRLGFRVVVDVMDLPSAQFEDLGYNLQMRASTLRRFERLILRGADWLWVCSESIGRLIGEDYGVERDRIVTALNGYHVTVAPRSRSTKGSIRFAYAGSMNREREVEPLIAAFLASDLEQCELHLCGPFGDWIPETYTNQRVIYHGSLSDAEAAEALSDCHMGLIPYPEKGYYHLAFATKLAFYLGLGIPVLCSMARETASHVANLNVGMCRAIGDFSAAFRQIAADPRLIDEWGANVLKIRDEFAWDTIYSRALATTTGGCGTRELSAP
jgi:hypothetical protein